MTEQTRQASQDDARDRADGERARPAGATESTPPRAGTAGQHATMDEAIDRATAAVGQDDGRR